MPPLAFLNLGPWEIALIVFLVLIFFGGKRLPSLAKDLGNGIKEFRKSLSAAAEDDSDRREIPDGKKTPEAKGKKTRSS
ncbi:MAG TPA: twin-arginine translocase TatA/TatE family subunit [Leptospiraceae bacterium]|nr:twin-arginine translocase TatA/TatE family subunit [Leptospiraceae bacterium]HMY67038.1 twin-arginine translocase TatA/TatE family subunit [Leptospiraceae bacterium]HMZ59766.1 twin-arginine translocase TatA/TatE family subunit [Leptospiraceae bacterium]HNF23969.1 twin-arginine translocase TatA/TatE family subunit [Leptospiraceae bacterium]HNH07107.1 twin-arginine translocase TatA/TatE family subunit [Leptospiraceae bacterium]